MSVKLSKLFPKPPWALCKLDNASTVFLEKFSADIPVAFIPSAVDAPNVSCNNVVNPGNLSAIWFIDSCVILPVDCILEKANIC